MKLPCRLTLVWLLAGLGVFTIPIARAEIISNGDLNTPACQYANTVGTNDRHVPTNGSVNATVRMTLGGDPSDFVRAESAP